MGGPTPQSSGCGPCRIHLPRKTYSKAGTPWRWAAPHPWHDSSGQALTFSFLFFCFMGVTPGTQHPTARLSLQFPGSDLFWGSISVSGSRGGGWVLAADCWEGVSTRSCFEPDFPLQPCCGWYPGAQGGRSEATVHRSHAQVLGSRWGGPSHER